MTHLLIIAGIIACSSGSLFSMEPKQEPASTTKIPITFKHSARKKITYAQLTDLATISDTIYWLLKDFGREQEPELHFSLVTKRAFETILDYRDLATNYKNAYALNAELKHLDSAHLIEIIQAAEYLDIPLISQSAQSLLAITIKKIRDYEQKDFLLRSLEKQITVLHPEGQQKIFSSIFNTQQKEIFNTAARNGLLTLSRLMLKYYIEPMEKTCTDGQKKASRMKTEALVHALQNKHRAIIDLLLNANADPNKKDILFEAIKTNDEDIVQLMLDHGADPHIKSVVGLGPKKTALDYAIELSASKKIILILLPGCEINSDMIYYLINRSQTDILYHLIKHTKKHFIDDDELQPTIVQYAIKRNNIKLLKKCLKKGFNLYQDSLHACIEQRIDTQALEFILSYKLIDPTQKNDAGLTPLELATRYNNTAAVALLLEYSSATRTKKK